jgi:hypothetical protein
LVSDVIAIDDETADGRHGVGVFLLGIWLAWDWRIYGPLVVKIEWRATLINVFGFFRVVSRAFYGATCYFARVPRLYTVDRWVEDVTCHGA